MNFRIDRFLLDEKDLFVALFGLFLIVMYLLKISVYPFRFASLVVVFLFLLTTRSLVNNLKFTAYLMIALSGLVFSTFLSPYGLLVYFLLAMILYKKTNLI